MNFILQMAKLFITFTSNSLRNVVTWVVFSPLKACHIKTETFTYEEKEQQLVNDCVKELRK